ncbi:MAG: diacylglycerol kinase family protein [Clostridiales bacterium]|nr:diacylglycerol kinase family protein [Clostridiales bacterium]
MEKKDPLHRSFGYAFEGIDTCIKKERNMKIHCMMAIFVIIAGMICKISVIEWCICFILFGLIMALELVNTAVEATVDLITEERKPLAKIAKDTAAGAVLIAAIMAAVVGCIIFLPKVLVMIGMQNFLFM